MLERLESIHTGSMIESFFNPSSNWRFIVGKYFAVIALVVGLIAGATTFSVAEDWAAKASFTDACSCNPSCPCVYGSPPTQGFCEGNGLVEVNKGHYGDVNLDGVSAVVTYHMGADGTWTKYYVSDKASDQQVKAMSKLIPAAFGFLGGAKVLAVEKAPLSVKRTESRVNFSVPASTVELEMVKGADGKPITVQNLPAQGFPGPHMIDYTLYKTVELTHNGSEGGFNHSGTSGNTSRIDVQSKN